MQSLQRYATGRHCPKAPAGRRYPERPWSRLMLVVSGGYVRFARSITLGENRINFIERLLLRRRGANRTWLKFDFTMLRQLDALSRPKDTVLKYGVNGFHDRALH